MFLLQTLVFSAFGVLLRNICLLTILAIFANICSNLLFNIRPYWARTNTKRSLFSSALSGQKNNRNTETLMHFQKQQWKEFVGFFFNYLKNIGPGSGISGSAG